MQFEDPSGFLEKDSGSDASSVVSSSDEEGDLLRNMGNEDSEVEKELEAFFEKFDEKLRSFQDDFDSSSDLQPHDIRKNPANNVEKNTDANDSTKHVSGEEDNDEAFYDPGADMEDEEYVKKYMRVNGELHTDAQLSCPNCFAVVCLDCQKHETQEGLFRAMFVFNCSISEDNKYTDGKKSFPEVSCKHCRTSLGVMGDEEIIEFFNVLPSLA